MADFNAETERALGQLDDALERNNRAEIMKNVVGPLLQRLLQPVFKTGLSDNEAGCLSGFSQLIGLRRFNSELRNIVLNRATELFDSPDQQTRLDLRVLGALNHRRPKMLYESNVKSIIQEGVTTGVNTPITIGLQIHLVEGARKASDNNHAVHSIFSEAEPVSPLDLIRILKRPSIATILKKLCKGPNGFLGENSIYDGLCYDEFFDFSTEREVGGSLPVPLSQAYMLDQSGIEVVGLSDAYEIAANRKRRQIYRCNSKMVHYDDVTSSGCPVRHSFEDHDSDPQEPLVITAKDFVVSALEIVQR